MSCAQICVFLELPRGRDDLRHSLPVTRNGEETVSGVLTKCLASAKSVLPVTLQVHCPAAHPLDIGLSSALLRASDRIRLLSLGRLLQPR